MNLAQLKPLEEESTVDMTPFVRQKIIELTETIEAVRAIHSSNYWKVLEKNVFGGVLQSLHKRLEDEKDEKEMWRLQGQAVWASKYCDFTKLAEVFEKELLALRNKLHGKE